MRDIGVFRVRGWFSRRTLTKHLLKNIFILPHIGLSRHPTKAGARAEGNEKLGLFPDLLDFVFLLFRADATGYDTHHGLGNLHGCPLAKLTKELVVDQGRYVEEV